MSSSSLLVIDDDYRRRHKVCREFLDRGCHAEPYEHLDSVRTIPPSVTAVLVHDHGGSFARLLNFLADQNRWIPILAYAEAPRIERVVDVVKEGVEDFISWPATFEEMSLRLRGIAEERGASARIRAEIQRSRKSVSNLSPREQQILALLACGGTNKSMARELDLSPRTVELHRAHMMGKLQVDTAGAVRIALYANLGGPDEDLANDLMRSYG